MMIYFVFGDHEPVLWVNIVKLNQSFKYVLSTGPTFPFKMKSVPWGIAESWDRLSRDSSNDNIVYQYRKLSGPVVTKNSSTSMDNINTTHVSRTKSTAKNSMQIASINRPAIQSRTNNDDKKR